MRFAINAFYSAPATNTRIFFSISSLKDSDLSN